MAQRFVNDRSLEATRRFAQIAARHRRFADCHGGRLESATRLRRLDHYRSHIRRRNLNESLEGVDLILDAETMARIDEVDVDIPNPLREDGLRRL